MVSHMEDCLYLCHTSITQCDNSAHDYVYWKTNAVNKFSEKKYRMLPECSWIIEFIKQVLEKRLNVSICWEFNRFFTMSFLNPMIHSEYSLSNESLKRDKM